MDIPQLQQFRESLQPKIVEEVELNDGVKKRIIKQGDGPMPNPGQEVKINFSAKVENSFIFDSSDKRNEPLKINVGSGQLIDGCDIGIMSMKLGEHAEIWIHPKYAYGKIGCPPHIPGNSTLVYTIELIQIGERRPTKWSMTQEELVTIALRLKDDGNAKYKEKKYKEAENLYRDGVSHMKQVREESEQSKKVRVTLHQNLALMLNLQENYKEAIQFCDQILALDSSADKAYYHRHTANFKMKQYDEAISDLKEVIKIHPNEKKYRVELEKIKEVRKKQNQKNVKQMQNMFSEGIYEDKDNPDLHHRHNELPKFTKKNPQCYFDICIGNPADKEEEKLRGRVIFEVFKQIVPKSAENFRCFCTGERQWDRHYKDSIFFKIEPGKYIHGGDMDCQNGNGGLSIYGRRFDDERIWLPHSHRGLVTSVGAEEDDMSCQFLLTFAPLPDRDMKSTVFARVIHNYALIEKAKNIAPGENNKPLKRITIEDCGQLKGPDKLKSDQCDSLYIYDEK